MENKPPPEETSNSKQGTWTVDPQTGRRVYYPHSEPNDSRDDIPDFFGPWQGVGVITGGVVYGILTTFSQELGISDEFVRLIIAGVVGIITNVVVYMVRRK